MIEAGFTNRMPSSELMSDSGDNPNSAQNYRFLTSDITNLCKDPNDLQSLSWLTAGDLPRLQQPRAGQGEFSMSGQDQLHAGARLSNMNMSGGTSMVHVQSNIQHSPLGINCMPQFSPSFPSPVSAYQHPPQQVMTFSQSNQQCSHGGLYNTFNNPSLFTHQQIHTAHSPELQPKLFPKPVYSYSCLIAMALKNSKTGSLPVSDIYCFMKEHFPYFKTAPDGWKNSVRHNLSLNKCFEKVENKLNGSSRKGCLWALNPAKIDKMEEEMQKWKRKDLAAIHRSMANPDELDKLITDRPECCRRNTLDLPPPPQPILPPHCHLHHHLYLQLHTPPHTAPRSPAPVFYHVPEPTPTPTPTPELFSRHSDGQSDTNVLDHIIMDFDLQESMWDNMKDESFNLDELGPFSNSPLHLSDCDLLCVNDTPLSGAEHIPFVGVYSSYSTVEELSSQYNTQTSSQPIALH